MTSATQRAIIAISRSGFIVVRGERCGAARVRRFQNSNDRFDVRFKAQSFGRPSTRSGLLSQNRVSANVALACFIQDGRMSIDDQPRAVFGRRGREIRAPAAQAGRVARPARAIGRIVCLFGLAGLLLAVVGGIFWTLPDIEKLNAEITRAEQRVTAIVNQPITHLPRTGPVGLFSPGWFHPDAIKPDFNNVDIRATQEFPYVRYNHVSSDVNPSEMFDGSELEFNAMTKYFYTDRTLPKKRLSDTEMVEINSLYRVIGRDEQALSLRWLTIAGLVAVGVCLASGLFLVLQTLRRATG
jgi:hypothetical protein